MNTAHRDTWTRRVCGGIIAVCIVEFLVATIGVQIRHLPRSTDFASYYVAGALASQGVSPYDRSAQLELAADRHLGFEPFPFLYPPTFALLLQPLARLTYPQARQVWMLLSTLALLVALGLTFRLTRDLARRLGVQNDVGVWVLLATFTAAALNSTGVHNDIRAGSVGILLYLCWTGAALGLLRRREAAGGLWLGLATLLKLVPAAALAWLLWRRRWIGVIAGGAIVLLAFGAETLHWKSILQGEYVRQALWPALHGEVARPMNQSLDAAWSRLLVPGEHVQSPFVAPTLKFWLSLCSSLALLALTLRALTRAPWRPDTAPLVLGLVAVTLLVLMKITWLHTLTAVLFVWPVLMVHVLAGAQRGQGGMVPLGVMACVGFFLSAAHLPVLWHALQRGPAVLLISAHLVGLLVLWDVTRRILRLSGRD